MEIMEIILLVAGGIIFVLSFFIPDRREAAGGLTQDDVRSMVDQALEDLRGRVDEVVEESAAYGMEKTERSLERLSNEKIMAINEYSDTVLAQIHKSHEEVMFLYDMLNNKHASLKNAAAEASRAVKEAEAVAAGLRGLMVGKIPAEAPKQEDQPLPSEEAVPTRKQGSSRRKKKPEASGGTESGEDEKTGNNREKIMDLHRQGRDVASIAKELGIGVGEVKLVVDLFQNQL